MGLINKIKENAKRLALAGTLISPLGLNGCIAHGSPQEMSNFFFRDILGFPGMKENHVQQNQQVQDTGVSIKIGYMKDGMLYDRDTGNKIMNEYIVSEKFRSPYEGHLKNKTLSLVSVKVGNDYITWGFIEY